MNFEVNDYGAKHHMTLNEFIDAKKKAICLNFAMRNESSYGGSSIALLRAQRQKVRSMIREVRMAQSKETAFMVSAVIANLPSPKQMLH